MAIDFQKVLKENKKLKEKEKKSKGLIPKDLKKILDKRKLNPVKAVAKGLPDHSPLVREGRTGYFSDEYEKEVRWLGK